MSSTTNQSTKPAVQTIECPNGMIVAVGETWVFHIPTIGILRLTHCQLQSLIANELAVRKLNHAREKQSSTERRDLHANGGAGDSVQASDTKRGDSEAQGEADPGGGT